MDYGSTQRAEWGRELYEFQRRQNPWLPNFIDSKSDDYVPVPDEQRSHFAVIEVRLRLFTHTTINLLDQNWTDKMSEFVPRFESKERTLEDEARVKTNYEFVVETNSSGGVSRRLVPLGNGHIRTRDCIFFNEFLKEYPEAQSILAAFVEGKALVPGVNVGERDHVQINVLDQSIIDLTDVTFKDAADVLDSKVFTD